MPLAKESTLQHPVEDGGEGTFVVMKVRLSPTEKAAFQKEARSHNQKDSAYARFILEARKDPVLFLKLCTLRDPSFTTRLLATEGPGRGDSERVSELERQVLQLSHERETLARDAEDLRKERDELERRLGEATDRAQAMAAHVVSLVRIQDAVREKAIDATAAYEAVPKSTRLIIAALSATSRMTRAELENFLVDKGLTKQEAAAAIIGAARVELIQKGADSRYRLAKQPEDEE